MRVFAAIFLLLFVSAESRAAINKQIGLPLETGFKAKKIQLAETDDSPLIFDIPIAYNKHVQKWISHYQGPGRKWFQTWLERAHHVQPKMQLIFQQEGLPQDLVYMAMIESGYSPHAVSSASAVGPWQFIRSTGERFGLKINWWLDERRDFEKSTRAAAKYIRYLHNMFGSWYLVGAAYNTGENRVLNIVRKFQTKNFWELVKHDAFVEETENYIPKMLAAALVAKAPNLYGFRGIKYTPPPKYEYFMVPGGTRLKEIADALNVTSEFMKQLNPELILGYVPESVSGHRIRVPKGSLIKMSEHFRRKIAQQ